MLDPLAARRNHRRMGLRGILEGISHVETKTGSAELSDASVDRIAQSYLSTKGENVPRAVLNRVSGIVLLESTFPGDVKRLHDAVDALVGKAELPFGADTHVEQYRTRAVRDGLEGASIALERMLDTPKVAGKLREAYGYEASVALKSALAHLSRIENLDAPQALEPAPGYAPETKSRRAWAQDGLDELGKLVNKLEPGTAERALFDDLQMQFESALASIAK